MQVCTNANFSADFGGPKERPCGVAMNEAMNVLVVAARLAGPIEADPREGRTAAPRRVPPGWERGRRLPIASDPARGTGSGPRVTSLCAPVPDGMTNRAAPAAEGPCPSTR